MLGRAGAGLVGAGSGAPWLRCRPGPVAPSTISIARASVPRTRGPPGCLRLVPRTVVPRWRGSRPVRIGPGGVRSIGTHRRSRCKRFPGFRCASDQLIDSIEITEVRRRLARAASIFAKALLNV